MLRHVSRPDVLVFISLQPITKTRTTLFQAPAATLMKPALLGLVTQHSIVEIPYRRTKVRPDLFLDFLTLDGRTDKLS
jgi:hypothetical protein